MSNEGKSHSHGMGRVTVEVTETDIARAIVSDSYKCVVAQAIARTIKDSTKIEVDIQTVRFTRESTGKRYVYLTPFTVQGYIVAFDAGEQIAPFTFRLTNPNVVRRRIVKPVEFQPATKVDRQQLSLPLETEPIPDNVDESKSGKSIPDNVDESKSGKSIPDNVDEPYIPRAPRWNNDGPMPPPRAFKKKSRAYGLRTLRYNQERKG